MGGGPHAHRPHSQTQPSPAPSPASSLAVPRLWKPTEIQEQPRSQPRATLASKLLKSSIQETRERSAENIRKQYVLQSRQET